MTQRHCVFKPRYAKSRTTKSIPGLYKNFGWIWSVTYIHTKETNACENCKSNENGVTKKCYKCRKIGIKKMAEKIRIDGGKNLKQRNFSVTNNNRGSNWTCLKCKKKFKQVAKLMFHKKTCSLAKPGKALLCKMCQKIFVSKSTLQRHVQVTHLPLKNSE